MAKTATATASATVTATTDSVSYVQMCTLFTDVPPVKHGAGMSSNDYTYHQAIYVETMKLNNEVFKRVAAIVSGGLPSSPLSLHDFVMWNDRLFQITEVMKDLTLVFQMCGANDRVIECHTMHQGVIAVYPDMSAVYNDIFGFGFGD